MLTMMDSFKTEGHYTLQHHGANVIKPELEEYVLEEREVSLVEYFDPNTYQLIEYVNKLARIYSRQHICVNKDGAIKGLLNLPEIKTKWELLKKELMQVNPIAAFEIVQHKERELGNPVAVVDNLSNAHFMQLFLYDYGVWQQQGEVKRQVQVRDRMGIGFTLPVLQTFVTAGRRVQTEAILDGVVDKKLISSITGQEELEVKHFTRGAFEHDEQGGLVAAEMTVFEQLNKDYTSDLYLHLELCNG